MTNADYTHLALIIDTSGSMSVIRQDMEGGIQTFLHDQEKEPGKLLVDVTTFNTFVDQRHSDAQVSDIPQDLIHPTGGTALYDAVGQTIVSLGKKFAELEEYQRPAHVIVVIVTDGWENSSREWTQQAIKAMIEQQQSEYAWEFVFLGANIDAAAVAGGIGIAGASALNYSPTAQGATASTSSLSSYVTRTRSGLATEFTQAERDAAAASN